MSCRPLLLARRFLSFRLLVFYLAIVLSGTCTLAQNAVSTGSLSGILHDTKGAVLPGVGVELNSEDRKFSKKTLTNAGGVYLFAALPVGSYQLSFKSPGFRPAKLTGVQVKVGRTTNADVNLDVGEVKTEILVKSDIDVLSPKDASPGTIVGEQLTDELPSSGRRYTDFVLLTPNVTTDGDFGHVSFAGQSGGTLSGYLNNAVLSNANGSSAFTVDGANATSRYYGDFRGYTRIPYLFGLQSVQEFQVVSNAYNAQYGGAIAGFVNTVTKSGSNAWHWDAFYYLRNSATGSNDAIDRAAGNPKPLNILNQFGADIGGPLIKNRLFFYFDYEQQRQLTPLYVAGTLQSTVDETSFGVPAGTSLPPVNSHFPVPGQLTSTQATADPTNPAYLQGVSNALNAIHSNIGIRQRRRDDLVLFPKLDWNVTEKDRLTLLYNYNKFDSPGGIVTFTPAAFAGVEALGNNGVRDHNISLHWTRTFSPRSVNDVYASWARDEQIYTPSGLVNPSAPLVQLIQPQYFGLGNETFAYNNLREYQFELADHFSYFRGKHQLQFGVAYNRAHFSDDNPGTFFGQYTFLTLQHFALGKWDIYQQGSGNPKFNFTVPYFAVYANDTIRLLPKLTLSVGLREEFQVFPDPNGNPALPFSNRFNNQYQRISPRLGFAYQPFEKTVVRGGIGLYYGLLTGANYQNSTQANGVLSQQASLQLVDSTDENRVPVQQAVVFPNRLQATDPRFAAGTNIAVIDPNFKAPSAVNGSLTIDREIAPLTRLSVGSAWSHGMHITASTAYDLNQLPPVGSTRYIICPPATAATATSCSGPTYTGPNLDSGLVRDGRISTQFGQINALISPGVNNYVSFFTQVERQFSPTFNTMFAYTLAKTTQSGVDFYNQFDLSNTHGLSLLDQRHRLSIAAVWSPRPTLSGGAEKALLSNWTISLLSSLNSGRPYTGLLQPAASGNFVNNTAALQTTPNTAAGLAGHGPTPGQGLNSFTGPWLTSVDMGLQRNFRIRERHNIALKAQVFNVLNTANYHVEANGGINTNQYNPVGSTCGDGKTLNQTCYLLPATGFKQFTAVSQRYGPRIFQFSFSYSF